MTVRDHHPDDGPEIVPPAEMLRLRAALRRPPAPQVRAQQLAATAMAARQRHNTPMGRFASRGARAAVAIVAGLAITSGLAGAQLLPDSAQRLLSNVSERFAPDDTNPPADPAQPGSNPADDDSGSRRDEQPRGADDTTTTTEGDGTTTTSIEDERPTTTTSRPSAPTTTTVPGPVGPGSPDEPIDPGPTDPGPTDPEPTTTTTVPPTTTTTVPPTTTTTVPPTTTTTVPLTPDDLRAPRSRP